ncbi:MAG: hypothetical protein U9R79_14875 [Armatimonadota bacterium]|nr:hypothetical protein [Armatimonadota bacterium]
MMGCQGAYAPTVPSPNEGGEPTAVSLSPSEAQVVLSGETVQFTATLSLPGDRTEDATEESEWSWTGPAAVGSINSEGLFTAGEECGEGTIVVRYAIEDGEDGGVLEDTVAVRVRVITGLEVTPAGAMELCAGVTQQFQATLIYCDEDETENVTEQAEWSWTGATGTGGVDASGLFTAGQTEGTGVVRASYADQTASSGTITTINSGDVPITISQSGGGCN